MLNHKIKSKSLAAIDVKREDRIISSHNKSTIENKKVLKTKDSLIYQLLKRWWYAIEEWPPSNYNAE